MPTLCPLVQALAGPSSERSGTQTPLARALFGRGAFARSGGSSSNMKDRSAGSSSDSTTASNSAFPIPAQSAPRYTPGPNVPVGGPVSTARASASRPG